MYQPSKNNFQALELIIHLQPLSDITSLHLLLFVSTKYKV